MTWVWVVYISHWQNIEYFLQCGTLLMKISRVARSSKGHEKSPQRQPHCRLLWPVRFYYRYMMLIFLILWSFFSQLGKYSPIVKFKVKDRVRIIRRWYEYSTYTFKRNKSSIDKEEKIFYQCQLGSTRFPWIFLGDIKTKLATPDRKCLSASISHYGICTCTLPTLAMRIL